MADAMQIDQRLQAFINQPLDELVKDNKKTRMQKKKPAAGAAGAAAKVRVSQRFLFYLQGFIIFCFFRIKKVFFFRERR